MSILSKLALGGLAIAVARAAKSPTGKRVTNKAKTTAKRPAKKAERTVHRTAKATTTKAKAKKTKRAAARA